MMLKSVSPVLDRRALSAVASNSGGLFSAEEQNIAQSIMSQQQSLAMGLYSGPTSHQADFIDPFQGDSESMRLKAGVEWLDQVSDDEKNTIGWAYSRASAQTSYNRSVPNGASHENLDSTNSLARLITMAMSTMDVNPSRDSTYGSVTTPAELFDQPWFQGFRGQFQETIEQMNKT